MIKRYNDKFRNITIVIFILGVIYYGYHQTKNLILGSQINIISPTNRETIFEPSINIKGDIKNASYIYLNGKQIFTDEGNNIDERVLLFEGYNLFQIKTVDKFEKEKIKNIEIIHIPKESQDIQNQNDIIISN